MTGYVQERHSMKYSPDRYGKRAVQAKTAGRAAERHLRRIRSGIISGATKGLAPPQNEGKGGWGGGGTDLHPRGYLFFCAL